MVYEEAQSSQMTLKTPKTLLALFLALGNDQEVVQVTQALEALGPAQSQRVIYQSLENCRGDAKPEGKGCESEELALPGERQVPLEVTGC